jgi:DNA-binding transcriptional ArsR family regulator
MQDCTSDGLGHGGQQPLQRIEDSFNSSIVRSCRVPQRFLAGSEMPLYEIKANLFKALAHPARIRTLEILSASGRPTPVSEILAATDIEPTLLSQHLAVLKRHHVVNNRRVGNAVYYELAPPKISELLLIAPAFLPDTLTTRRDQLDALDSLPPLGIPR